MKIKNKLGYHLPLMIRLTGYIILTAGFIGFLIDISSFIRFVILTIIGGFLAFSAYGIIADTRNKRVKLYNSFFGFRFGKWYDASQFKEIIIHPESKVYTTFSRANIATSYKETLYCMYLYDPTDDEEVVVRKFSTVEKAEAYKTFFSNLWISNS